MSPAHDRTGLFIVFEGGEGTGKSTQVKLLADALRVRDPDREVVTTQEPGGTDFGRLIRAMLLSTYVDQMDPYAETMLFLANRADHVARVIRPALQRGAIVLCDRYADSTIVYQGHARNLGIYDVERMSDWVTRNLRPDMVLVLDVDPAEGLARVADRGITDGFEREPLSFHHRVRAGFAARVEQMQRERLTDQAWAGVYPPTPWYFLVGADGPVNEVAARVLQYATTLLEHHTPDVEEPVDAATEPA